MAQNKDIEKSRRQKSHTPKTGKNLVNDLVNKFFYLLNIGAILLLAYQAMGFLDTYSKKTTELFNQGRIINIDTRTNDVALSELSEDEINKLAADNNNAVQAEAEKNPAAAVPVVSEDNAEANLAIVIMDIGLKQSDIEEANMLPKEVAFSFSPYSDELQKKIDAALADGREALLTLVMQPSSFPARDNGPLSIQSNYEEDTNLARYTSVTGAATGYIGLLASDDELMTSKFEKLSPLLTKVKEKELFFGYFRNANNVNLENDVKPLGVSVFAVDKIIDANESEDEIIKNLNVVKEDILINKKKLVIAIHPSAFSIELVKKWLADNANIKLTTVSKLVTKN